MIYLDSNATTRPTEGVTSAMLGALREQWHNPSSAHRPGQAARGAVERARASVGRLLGCLPREVVFTSGGTESIALAIRSALAQSRERAVVTTAVEHEAVRGVCDALAHRTDAQGGPVEIRIAPVSSEGIVDLGAMGRLIDDRVALVTAQWANNETGAIQPVAEIGALCAARGVPFHTDATQWAGKGPIDVGAAAVAWVKAPGALLTCSAHKFHGPKGVGALVVRGGLRIDPAMHGSQESGRRGGTENVPGIVGMGVAAEEAIAWLAPEREAERLAARTLRDRLERAILERCAGAKVNGPHDPLRRLWNTTNIMFPGVESETLLMLLSERGVCASGGAACASGSLEPSPALEAMGRSREEARSSVRFSLSRETTEAEITTAIEEVVRAVASLRES